MTPKIGVYLGAGLARQQVSYFRRFCHFRKMLRGKWVGRELISVLENSKPACGDDAKKRAISTSELKSVLKTGITHWVGGKKAGGEMEFTPANECFS